MDGSTSSKSCPVLEEPCCQGFEILCHSGDGEFGDGHVLDQAWADPIAVEMQLLLASEESTSLFCCGVRGGDW